MVEDFGGVINDGIGGGLRSGENAGVEDLAKEEMEFA